MKPDWKDAPEWALWLAQDHDGDWWFYEEEPIASGRVWRSDYKHEKAPTENENWVDSLEPRP